VTEAERSTCYVRFAENRCTACAACLRVCPTKAIRIKNGRSILMVDQCIGCGHCIRVCPSAAVSAASATPEGIGRDHIAIALVSPVLYAQFPGVMPKDVLQGLREMGFHHTVDMSYFLEMFQCAAEEFIRRNRRGRKAPWPLISPICPVVVRLIAFKFPNLLANVLPVLRPVALTAREVKHRIVPEYTANGQRVILYYINPCPTQREAACDPAPPSANVLETALGINDVYPELRRHVERICAADQMPFSQTRFEYENCATGNPSMWAMSGGEIADMDVERSLAVAGIRDTIAYLEKIEMGLFQDMEYIEFRTCREGCLGGVLNVIDRHLAKRAVQTMVKTYGLGRRLSRDHILRLYDKGLFQPEMRPTKLLRLFGSQRETLTLAELQRLEEISAVLPGKDCTLCGCPDCRTLAEDIVRGRAALADCVLRDTNQAMPPPGQ
jgi:iron only hydrogenase large subunit-like protein